MTTLSRFASVGLIVFGFAASGPAHAQCWQPGFHLNGTDDEVFALGSFDDGSGPALFVGGRFRAAGTVGTRNLVKWDGSAWSPLGTGVGSNSSDVVLDLLGFDDGSGPALFVAGSFHQAGGVDARGIAAWNGITWRPVGTGLDSTAAALAVFDDGSGPALYAGGAFETAGGVLVNHIARWNGSAWSPLGTGLEGDGYASVSALTVFDDGSGPALFAGGTFDTAGGVTAGNIARWNGSTWSAVAGGTNGNVSVLRVFDDGSGPALYVGGVFGAAGGSPTGPLARWNGANWSTLGGGAVGSVGDLAVFDDGSGPALHLVGAVTPMGGVATRLAKWNGSDWSPVPGAMSGAPRVLGVFDDGSGSALYCGGSLFHSAGGVPAYNLARWNGTAWSAIGDGSGVDNSVGSFLVHDDGSGPALYVGGGFDQAGGIGASRIAKWNGVVWSPLGSGMEVAVSFPRVQAMATFDDGGGAALYAAGYFTTAGGVPANDVAKWDGAQWSALGSGVDVSNYAVASALAVFDDGSGPALYMAGSFTSVGGTPASCIAKWDGVAWTALGSGMSEIHTNSPTVGSLLVFDDGTGPALYAGGFFSHAGGVPASYIAKWNGSVWSAVGGGTSHVVACMTVFDDGSGPALFAGGVFLQAGGAAASRIAKWDGAAWSALGSGVGDATSYADVASLAVFDEGSGPALYVGGHFDVAGGIAARSFARWKASQWSTVGLALDSVGGPSVVAQGTYDSGAGRALYVGGGFEFAGGHRSNFIAAWGPCSASGAGESFCVGDGSGTACPCGNSGMLGHGCENSSSTGGALLAGSGRASLAADTVLLASTGERPAALSIFLQGNAQLGSPALFGDGLRCAGGALKRLYVKNASAGTVIAPTGPDASVSARSSALGDPIHAGAFRIYQVYYRDPTASFCPSPPGSTFNASQALRIVWGP